MSASRKIVSLPHPEQDSGWGIDFPYTLIPEGAHDFTFLYHDTILYRERIPKVVLTFERFNDPENTLLYKFYNATKIEEHKLRNGKFKASYHGDLVQDYMRILGLETPGRMDRNPFSRYRAGVMEAEVSTVTPEGRAPYSKIRRLIRLIPEVTTTDLDEFCAEYESGEI